MTMVCSWPRTRRLECTQRGGEWLALARLFSWKLRPQMVEKCGPRQVGLEIAKTCPLEVKQQFLVCF